MVINWDKLVKMANLLTSVLNVHKFTNNLWLVVVNTCNRALKAQKIQCNQIFFLFKRKLPS